MRLRILQLMGVLLICGIVAAEDAPTPDLSGPSHGGGEAGTTARDFTGSPMRQRPGEAMWAALEQLDLTAEQDRAIRRIVADHAGQLDLRRRALAAERLSLQKAREARDEAAIVAAQQNIKTIQENSPDAVGFFDRINAALTEAQRQQLRESLKLDQMRHPESQRLAELAAHVAALELRDNQREKVEARIKQATEAMAGFAAQHQRTLANLEIAAIQAAMVNDRESITAARQRMRQIYAQLPAEVRPMNVRRAVSSHLTAAQRQALAQRYEEETAAREGMMMGDTPRATRTPPTDDGPTDKLDL